MPFFDRLSVVVITPDADKRKSIEGAIQRHVSQKPTIYWAIDGADGQIKLRNTPPHLAFIDISLAKLRGTHLVNGIIADKKLDSVAIVITEEPPKHELYLDELVTGQVQFLHDFRDQKELDHCVVKALNYTSQREDTTFHLKFLAQGDQLIQEGTKGEFVYILKKGTLRAYQKSGDRQIELGRVEAGEFVGEMAYFNGEPRTASVDAVTDCELIEIPIGTLDRLLYKRPSWSKSLLMTLSKRLKVANARQVENPDSNE